MARIARFLKRAVADGHDDLEAREQMLLASSMGALAFQKGLGAAHALAHGLSPVAGTHHGLANALVLPSVLAFNREAVVERLAEVAVALGADPRASDDERAAAAVERVRALKDEVGLKGGLAHHGVREEMVPAVVAKAVEDASHLTNPRLCGPEDFRALLRDAW